MRLYSWGEAGAFFAVAIVAIVAVVVALVLVERRLGPHLKLFFDQRRPCSEHQARPAHVELIGVVFLIVLAMVLVAFYDPMSALRAALAGDAARLMIPLMVVGAPLGAVSLVLNWKNASVEQRGQSIRVRDWLGNQTDWLVVSNAWTQPDPRDPGRVYFEVLDRVISQPMNWRNIRPIYEALAASGVAALPWGEERKKRVRS